MRCPATPDKMAVSNITQTDQAIIDLLQTRDSMTVEEMIEALGVTATAIRQRLTRLLAGEFIERKRISEGRGRPKHQYSLTQKGKRTAGHNLADLAVSLWEEVQSVEDESVKRRIIEGVISRLAAKYETRGATVEERMKLISQMFAERKIPIECSTSESGLPIVTVNGCPYPDLASGSREICDMEQALFTKVIGTSVELCQCQQNGDQICSFEAVQPQAESGADAQVQ